MNRLLKIGIGLFVAKQIIKKGARIGSLKNHRFIPVYDRLPNKSQNGKTNLGFARGKSGVYVIKEDGKIVYVGQSGYDLYTIILRHFQQWTDSNYPARISYKSRLNKKRYTVRVVFVSPSRAAKLETGLIQKYRPRDNYEKLGILDDPNLQEKVDEVVQEYTISTADIPF